MSRYVVTMTGRKQGSIGKHDTEKLTITVVALEGDDEKMVAIKTAHQMGLEHITIRSIKPTGYC